MDIFEKIETTKVLPVAVIDRAADALALADALEKGGIDAVEVTFRTDAAAEAIALLRRERPDLLVGAGTVLTPAQVNAAAEAGAQFLVAPGLNPNTLREAEAAGLPLLPGVLTPSEVERAMELGLTRVKFFPAVAGGGVAMLKAMSAPYRQIKFLPTGGINVKNLADYLSLDCVFACGLSSVCDRQLINSGDFEGIERRAKQVMSALEVVKEGKHA